MKPGVHLAVVLTASVAAPSIARAEEVMTYEQAYREALRYSQLLMLAEADVAAADISYGATWTEVRPTVTAQGEAVVQRPVTNGDPYQLTGAIVANQPLFRKGFFAGRDAARHAVTSTTELAGRERERVARDVAIAMVDVIRARALVQTAKGRAARTNAQYEFAVQRVKAGAALKTAEMLSQIDVKRAEQQLVNVQRDVGVAEAAFQRLVGRLPPATIDLPIPTVDAAVDTKAPQDRRDVQALEVSIQQADQLVEAARGRLWWPRLDLSAQVRAFHPQDFDDRSWDWAVVGTVSIPLLQSGREAADVALARNQAHIARLTLERQRLLVTEEVQAAAVRVAQAIKGAEIADEQLKVAQEHYKLVDKQFKLGAITFLEVTNAQAALNESENTYEIARTDRIRAIYEYLFATGRLDPSALPSSSSSSASDAPAPASSTSPTPAPTTSSPLLPPPSSPKR